MSRATYRVLKSIVWPALRSATPVAFLVGCSDPKPPPVPPPGLQPVRTLVDAAGAAVPAAAETPAPDAAPRTVAPPSLPDAGPRTIPPPGMPPRIKPGMQRPNPKEKTELRRTPRRGPA